ncbi:MAG: EAL domain-containing protein [Planctomycetales bacterium]|nr:EAL domain-containing protein [Planctomycetales bacterium]
MATSPFQPETAIAADSSAQVTERMSAALSALHEALTSDTVELDDVPVVRELTRQLQEAEQELAERDRRLAELSDESEALARAQADAIVYSAEIIDELERTKQRLSDARAAAEKAAQGTQRLADTIFERTHDGVFVFHERECVACNDNALSLLRSDREQIMRSWPASFETAQFEDGAPAGQALQDLYRDASACRGSSLEVLLKTAGPSPANFWAEITMSAFSGGEADDVLVILRDITSRKKFESELRRHRDFLDNIINAVPDQIHVRGEDQRVVVANDAFCRAHGIRRDQVLGERIDTFLPVDLRKQVGEIEEQLLATCECKTTEHEFERSDGSRSIVSVKRTLFEDKAANQRYVVATSRDITEDRMREERLRLLASVFKGASEGVAILSPTGEIREANPAFAKMVASSPVGRQLSDVLDCQFPGARDVFAEVARGNSWAGKASGLARSYWISLSPSSETDEESTRVIALVSDITELEDTQTKLRRQAMYDTLTQLPNRRYFREHLQELIEQPSPDHRPMETVAICFIDLDDFKHVNDTAGHSVGDLLLQTVGARIRRVVGEDAFVARFGGDEFAVILRGVDPQSPELNELLDRLLVAFRVPFQLGDTEAVVGLSVGTTFYPEQATDVDTLMCNADIAMYAAKTAGKNRIRQFSPAMQADVNLRHQVQSQLRRALDTGEISVWFQPKVSAATREVVGCEALARWKTGKNEVISPGAFIPVAEQTGLILPLGRSVFRLAAEHACVWMEAGFTSRIAVNVSPCQIRHPRFVEQLERILEETHAKPDWFELEITENAMMDDVDHAAAVIDRLAGFGFHIAIDDFGTGYSSLSYLKDFNIHTLKIDLSFVRDVTHDKQSNAVIRSVISLGKGLGLTIVAEGVETAAQAEVLTEAGCNVLQGYHIARPMPAADYAHWLAEYRPPTFNI